MGVRGGQTEDDKPTVEEHPEGGDSGGLGFGEREDEEAGGGGVKGAESGTPYSAIWRILGPAATVTAAPRLASAQRRLPPCACRARPPRRARDARGEQTSRPPLVQL